MLESDVAQGIEEVMASMQRSGRPFHTANGQINTRCGFCGDSSKNASSRHFYLALEYPHPAFCQRCNFSSGELTPEILEALGAEDADAYARAVTKDRNRAGRRKRRGGLHLGAARLRMEIPPPDRSDPMDRAAIGYLEGRLGLDLSEREIQRYKIVCCGLFGLLDANGITDVTVKAHEAKRLNDTCVGWLSADESYAIFRNTDEEWEARGGRRYTNYRIHQSWEGSKVFACRQDVDLLAGEFQVVASEGIIDLIAIEREFYPEERWEPHFIGAACNGSTHAALLRMVLGLGVLSPRVDLYPDKEEGSMRKVRAALAGESPFFAEPGFRLRAFQNDFPGEKDFGVPRERMNRVRARA
jgi:hypothetical protein